MKYIVTINGNIDNECPCEGANLAHEPYWDTRTCSEEYYNDNIAVHDGGTWLSQGTRHHETENGWIRRQLGTFPEWTINIDTMEEMTSFIEKNGPVTITPAERPKLWEIEINEE